MEYTMNDDDIVYDYLEPPPRLAFVNDSASTTTPWTTRVAVMLTTFACILLFQYRVPLAAWLSSSSIWMHLQTLVEMIRYVLPLHFQLDNDNDSDFRRRRALNLAQMPPLEETNNNNALNNDSCVTLAQQQNAKKRQRPCRNKDTLEPAFLENKDYPPGWMVYDVDEGVILKTQADKLEQARQMKQQQQEATVCDTSTETKPARKQDVPTTTKETECVAKDVQSMEEEKKESAVMTGEEHEEASLQETNDDEPVKPQSPIVTAT